VSERAKLLSKKQEIVAENWFKSAKIDWNTRFSTFFE